MKKVIYRNILPARLLLLGLLLGMPGFQAAYGQTGKGISGEVTDARTGEALPGVNIRVQGTSQGTATDLTGYFQLGSLSPGNYDLSFSMMGYAPFIQRNVRLTADLPVRLVIKMKPNVLASPQVVVTSSRK